ncbi:Uncharacterised protein [BD1-7 clade bacterium]|uniref:Uncharacterized protein n=1 Tax=BD1-7 clade bacterium TaxID=2029982 RepID=A0A5S9PEI1_9GAMM|nr:Uncharacterised protein [BD1-7 clade bacterium]CAA0102050.1 Uncharacterised protein [BD1-7 clade bacterium]
MIKQMLIALSVATIMSGCIPNRSDVSVNSVQNNKTYDGYHDQGGSSPLPEKLVISYDSPRDLQVFFNGVQIGRKMTYEPRQAWIKFSDLKDFMREGTNKLVIDPQLILNAGPSMTFIADTEGPTVQPVKISGSEANPTVHLSAYDASDVAWIRINGTPAEDDDGDGIYTAVVNGNPTNDIFVLEAEDEHGRYKKTEYLKNGAEIKGIFRAEVGEGAIQGLTPLLNNAMAGQRFDREALERSGVGNVLYAMDAGVAHVYIKVETMYIGKGSINEFSFADEKDNRINLNVHMFPDQAYTHNDGNVTATKETAGIYAKVKLMTTCKPRSWYEEQIKRLEFGFCRTDWGYVDLLIETVDVTGQVDLTLNDGRFSVDLLDSVNIQMYDTKGILDKEGNSWTGRLISRLVPTLKNTGLFKTMTRNIIESTIANNLNQIRIGMNISNEEGHSFDLSTYADSVTTDDDSMTMTYNGGLKIANAPDNLIRSLGSVYQAQPIGEYLTSDTGNSNLRVNVNSNVINQGLDTLYSIGMTHVTVNLSDRKVLFGPEAIGDDDGKNGDRMLELVPSGPGSIFFHGTDTNQADIGYRNATMRVSEKKDGKWEQLFFANADIEAGVLMEARDKIMAITINQSPNLQINNLVQTGPLLDLGFFKLNVPDETLIRIVQFGFDILYPYLSNTELKIDIPNLESELDNGQKVSSEVTTDAFDTGNGHLRFNMSINPQVD